MKLLTHFLYSARKLGTRWYTKWLGMALSLGKRMEKRWGKDGKSVGEWQTIFFAWLYEGTTERDWMTSNSRTAFVLPFISRRCTLHTLANFAFTSFYSPATLSFMFLSLIPCVCSSNWSCRLFLLFFFFFIVLSSSGRQKLRLPTRKSELRRLAIVRGMAAEYRTINIKVRRKKIIKCTHTQRFRKLLKIVFKITID